MRDDLAARWARATFSLDESVIHGDAHMDNLLVTPAGAIWVIDLQTMSVGPPEWDLTLTALYLPEQHAAVVGTRAQSRASTVAFGGHVAQWRDRRRVSRGGPCVAASGSET